MRRKLLSTSQVAELLGVSDQSVANWVDNGQLKAGRTPGGHRRIAVEDLVEFMRRQGLNVPESLQKSCCILVVDDEPELCRYVASMLSRRLKHCRILTAFDGYAAGEMVTKHRPSALVLDLSMPGLDGFEICRRIKANRETRDIFVVIASTDCSPQVQKQTSDCGAAACLPKPFSSDELLAVLAPVVGSA